MSDEFVRAFVSGVPGVQRLMNAGLREKSFGNQEGAMDAYRRAIVLLEQAVNAGDLSERTHLAAAKCNLGALYVRRDVEDEDARAFYQEGLALYEQLAEHSEVAKGWHTLFQLCAGSLSSSARLALLEQTVSHLETAIQAGMGSFATDALYDLGRAAGLSLDEKDFESADAIMERAVLFGRAQALDTRGHKALFDVLKMRVQGAILAQNQARSDRALKDFMAELQPLEKAGLLDNAQEFASAVKGQIVRSFRQQGWEDLARKWEGEGV